MPAHTTLPPLAYARSAASPVPRGSKYDGASAGFLGFWSDSPATPRRPASKSSPPCHRSRDHNKVGPAARNLGEDGSVCTESTIDAEPVLHLPPSPSTASRSGPVRQQRRRSNICRLSPSGKASVHRQWCGVARPPSPLYSRLKAGGHRDFLMPSFQTRRRPPLYPRHRVFRPVSRSGGVVTCCRRIDASDDFVPRNTDI